MQVALVGDGLGESQVLRRHLHNRKPSHRLGVTVNTRAPASESYPRSATVGDDLYHDDGAAPAIARIRLRRDQAALSRILIAYAPRTRRDR